MSSEGGQAMSAAERRRQKILARGTERLKTITGQTTAEGAYVEAAAEVSTAGKRGGEATSTQNDAGTKDLDEVGAWMRATEDAKKKAAQAETAPRAEAAVASSTATTAEKESSGPSLPGRPTGAAALASKMTDSIESIRQQAREVMRAPASFSQPSLGPGDALQCAVSASGPIRLLATVLVAVSFARISLGGPVGRIPLQWQEKAIQLLAHPRFAGLAEIAAKTFAAFNPILLLVSLQACIVLSFVLMVTVVGGGWVRRFSGRKAPQGILKLIGGLAPGLRPALANLGALGAIVSALAGDVAIFIATVGLVAGVPHRVSQEMVMGMGEGPSGGEGAGSGSADGGAAGDDQAWDQSDALHF